MKLSALKIKSTLKLDVARNPGVIKLRFPQEQEPRAFIFLLPALS